MRKVHYQCHLQLMGVALFHTKIMGDFAGLQFARNNLKYRSSRISAQVYAVSCNCLTACLTSLHLVTWNVVRKVPVLLKVIHLNCAVVGDLGRECRFCVQMKGRRDLCCLRVLLLITQPLNRGRFSSSFHCIHYWYVLQHQGIFPWNFGVVRNGILCCMSSPYVGAARRSFRTQSLYFLPSVGFSNQTCSFDQGFPN